MTVSARAVPLPEGAEPVVTPEPDGLKVEWRAPAASVERQADGTVQVILPGYEQVRHPGQPQLPFASALIALPEGAEAILNVDLVESRVEPLPGPLALAPRPSGVRRAADGSPLGGLFVPVSPWSGGQKALDQVGATLTDPVALEVLGVVRGARLARVTFYPALPDRDGLRLTTYVRATIHFNSSRRFHSPFQTVRDPLLAGLQRSVLNPQDLSPSASAPILPGWPTAAGQQPEAYIEVKYTGLTAITYEDLAGAGVTPASGAPDTWQLYRDGMEIPLEWDGDDDAQFEPGERFLFLAEPRFSRWAPYDVYALHLGDRPGLRMESRSASPTGLSPGSPRVVVTAEENLIYTPDCFCPPIPVGRDGDRWVWDRLQRGDQAEGIYPVELTAVDPARPARLHVWLIGFTDPEQTPDHRLEIALNNTVLGVVEWDGKLAYEARLDVPAGLLRVGNNEVRLSLPGLSEIDVEGAWLDAFAIEYSRGSKPAGEAVLFWGEESPRAYTVALEDGSNLRAYDVTDPGRPVRLMELSFGTSGAVTLADPDNAGERRYWVSSEVGLLAPAAIRLPAPAGEDGPGQGADYLVIAPRSLRPALDSLLALRASQGLITAYEDVQHIYESFGDGRPDPESIRRYLAQAYATWAPRPTYVLLVGDGTVDPKRYNDQSTGTLIPAYLAPVDPWTDETATDNRFAAVDGDDNLPDLLLGRLPVNDLAEAQTVVEKIVQYESSGSADPQRSRAAFVADAADPWAGDFPVMTDALISKYFSGAFQPHRLYLKPGDPGSTRQAILDVWNGGTGLITFTGHASIHQWASERIFHLDDIARLENLQSLPVLLELTCFTSSFHHPVLSGLDEALLRHPGGGVVAAWGSTGLGISTGHTELAEGFFDVVLRQGLADLGTATLAGKLGVAANAPAFSDLIDTFTLLGDPATRVDLRVGSLPVFLPVIQR